MKHIDEEEKDILLSKVPNKTFCPAPFLHSYVNANNRGFKLCCMSHVIDRWDNKSDLKPQHDAFWSGKIMQDIREKFLQGEFPDACKWWCGRWEDEGLFHKSDRLDFIKKYTNDLDVDLTELTWSKTYGTEEYKKPIDIDLRPGKLCNLKCRSCNSIWSDKIEKEVLDNPEIQNWSHWDMIYKKDGVVDQSRILDWGDENFDVLSNFDFNNVYKLHISGGETLIDHRVLKILKKLCDQNIAEKMCLHIITNCTVLPSKTFNLLKNFKELTFNLSIDGVDATDEFLRDGTNWNKKEKVFNRIFEFENLRWAGILHVVQPVSVFQIKKNTKWFLEGFRKYEKYHNGVLFNPIVDPWYLSVSWLDEDHKDFVRKQMEECVTEFNMNDKEKSWFDVVYSELDKSQFERNTTYANDFVKAEKTLNKIRGTDTISIEPMLKRYFDRYDETNTTNTIAIGRPGAPFNGKPKPTV